MSYVPEAMHLNIGAIPVDERVVIDGSFVSAAGITAGIDGAWRVAALLRGNRVTQEIQLQIQYAPEPPFHSGTPATAAPEVLEAARSTNRAITEARLVTAKRIAARLGVVTHREPLQAIASQD